jgi:hypothetical protein
LWFKASPGKKLATIISTNKLGIVSHTCNPSYTGGVGRRIVVPGQPWKAKIMKPTKHFERGRKRERWNGNIVGGKLVQGALCTRIELSQ